MRMLATNKSAQYIPLQNESLAAAEHGKIGTENY